MKKILPPHLQSWLHLHQVRSVLNSFLLLSLFLTSLSGFAQGASSTNVDAGEDVILECGEDCTDLTATYDYIGDTSTYSVSSIPFEPLESTNGTPIVIPNSAYNIDDKWSNRVPLPFDFCFFGQSYSDMTISTNAAISFDSQYTPGNTSAWGIGEREAIPNPNLFRTTIFGPYMDIHPASGEEYKMNWEVLGEAPNRTMVINFDDIKYFSCNNLKLTSQIVIYETTNVIEIYIQDRPAGCSWNDGLAMLGIQNQTGTQGYVAPGRNTGDWSATNEAWRFTPNGESTVEFAWLDADGNVLGTDTTITVCPTEEVTVYTAQTTYVNCNGDIIVETDDVTVTRSSSFSVDLGGDQEFCDVPSYRITADVVDGNANDATFLWNTGETTQSITVTDSGTYTVEVTLAGCTLTSSVTIDFYQTPNIDLGEDINTCFVGPVTLDASPANYPNPLDLTYEWSFDGTVIAGETSPTLDITEAGTYGVSVSIGTCNATAEVNVGLGYVDIDLGADIETCFSDPVILDASPSNHDANDGVYEWTLNGSVISGETNATLTVSEIGTYGVTVMIGNCSATDTIEVLPMDDLVVSIAEGDLEVCPKEPHTLTAMTSDEGATYQWYLNGNVIDGATESTLEFSIEPGTIGTQVYSVVITVGGCTGTDSIEARLYPVGNCTISQGISPNGDGFNDILDLTFLNDRTGIKKLQIYNRYGSQVYEQNNYTNQWNGQSNDGKDLPTGTYFYVIDLAGEDAVYGQQATGWIYLTREVK